MIYFIFYIFGIICFLILLNDTANPFIVDILLSIFWPIEVSIILLTLIGIIIYNIFFE